MAYLLNDQIEPSDVTNAASDGALLDDVAALTMDELNLRSEAVALPHLSASRASTGAGSDLPITTWIAQLSVTTGTSSHAAVPPGTQVSPGGTPITLTPPAGARGTLREGDILRWHFHCMVDTVNDVVPDNDIFTIYVRIDGTDAGGAAVATSVSSNGLGISGNWSMNPAGQPAAGSAAGSNFEIEQHRVGISGVLIHRAADGLFNSNGDVHIDTIKIYCSVSNAANTVVLATATLVALIQKG